MKNFITALLPLAMLLQLSCTQVIYNNEQVLNRYKTKQDVARRFGISSEIKKSDTTESWLYKFDGHHPVNEHPNIQAENVTEFSKCKQYLVFDFDRQGKVTKWQYHDVNFEEKDAYTAGTVLTVAGITFVTAIAVLAYMWNH